MPNKKKNKKESPKVHKDLGDFSFKVDSFGEISTNIDIDKINEFLDDNVEDKKLDKEDIKKKNKKKDSNESDESAE